MSGFFESPPGSGLYVFSPNGTPPEGSPGTQPPVSYGWHTVESARKWWDPDLDDDLFGELLEIAQDVCERHAPVLADGVAVPARYRQAQLLYARETFNAAKVNPSGGYDEGSFAYSPFPVSWKVKGLLRPGHRIPAIG